MQSTPRSNTTIRNPLMKILNKGFRTKLADKFSTHSKSSAKKDTPKKFEKVNLEAYDWEQSRFFRDYILKDLNLNDPFE
jgi:hypothetical protein